MKKVFLFLLVTLIFTGCALVTLPVKVAGTAVKTTIKVVDVTAGVAGAAVGAVLSDDEDTVDEVVEE